VREEGLFKWTKKEKKKKCRHSRLLRDFSGAPEQRLHGLKGQRTRKMRKTQKERKHMKEKHKADGKRKKRENI